ncbi:MAG: BspA family leucine-rich repeat surface protein [Acetatifactor sp.]|nr:BspA family leucine-rich repeat surface protein [Acetatifactor sp.]
MEKTYAYDEKNNIVKIYSIRAVKDFCRDYKMKIEEFNFAVVLDDSMENCYRLFEGCSSFNQPVVIPENVTGCMDMFRDCKAFNQSIKVPDNVRQCTRMFMGCQSLNQSVELSKSAEICDSMFAQCKEFNQKMIIPLCVENTSGMFSGCSSFNQSIVLGENVINCGNMFGNCVSLNQKIELHSTNCYCDNMFYNCTSLLPENVTIYSKRTTQKNLEKKLQKMWGTEEINGTVNIVTIKVEKKAKINNIHYTLKESQPVDIKEEEIKKLTLSEIHQKLEELYQSGKMKALEISEESEESMKTLSLYFDEELCSIAIVDDWDDTVYYYNSGEGEELVEIQGNLYPRHMTSSDSELLFLIIDEFVKAGKPTKKVKWIKE